MKVFELFKKRWVRVSELGIVCPICMKPDWCRISSDGEYALCSRVPEYNYKGTMHKIDENIEINNTIRRHKQTPINWKTLNKSYVRNCGIFRTKQFSALKGLSIKNLLRMRLGFDGDCYTFPLLNDKFQMTGIQRQYPDGKKLMVKGSHMGLFIPTSFQAHTSPIVVTEGASDCTAALDLGLNAIGRLNNSSGTEILANICDVDTYIIADNDENQAGQNGAKKLANHLKRHNKIKTKIIIPPYKDLRKWNNSGELDKETIQEIMRKVPVL